MKTEINSTYNRGVKEIVQKLYDLRRIEFSDSSMEDKHKEASILVSNLSEMLYKKKNFLLYRLFWNELHDRMVYYYDYMNKVNVKKSIPLFRMTLHNEAIVWWLECMDAGKLEGPLIHCDTHDDMGQPKSTQDLLLPNGSVDRNGVSNGSCGMIYWPVTCLLLAKGTDQVIWGMPKWVYDDNASFNQVLTVEKGKDTVRYLRSSNEKKDNFMVDISLVDDKVVKNESLYKFYLPIQFDRIHIDVASGWSKLNKTIPGDKFILDIDLDFFVTNGDKWTVKQYKEDFFDLESDGRVHTVPGVTVPREMYSDDESINVVNRLNKEMGLIKKRISIFLSGLKSLKSKGKVPSCINLSDSCSSFLSGNIERAVFTNEYTPKYFVPMIHILLIEGFKEIYGKNNFF